MTRRPTRTGMVHAYTLLELLVAMSISVILVGASTSVVVLTSHAIPSSAAGDSVASSWQTGRVMNRMLNELRYATHFMNINRSDIAFTVPDRDADGRPERLRYAWSGKTGEPLYRYYNDEDPAVVVERVDGFGLGFDLDVTSETIPGTGGPSVSAMTVSEYTPVNTYNGLYINTALAGGQYIHPTLPGDATSWDLTALRVNMQQQAAGGEANVALYAADDNFKPTGPRLAEMTIHGSDAPVGAFGPVELPGLTLEGLAPDEGVCFVIEQVGFDPPVALQFDYPSGSGMLEKPSWEETWTHHGDRSLVHRATANVTVAGVDRFITRGFITAVDVELAVEWGLPLTSSVQTLNTPELLDGYWEMQFRDDPTWVDVNGDGAGDWTVFVGQYRETDRSTDGLWTPSAGDGIATVPQHDFDGITTVDLRFRLNSDATDGAVFLINADWGGGSLARIQAGLSRSAGSQTLVLSDHEDEGSPRVLATIADLPDTMVDVTLRIDPGAQIVHLLVNGADHGSHAYARFIPSNSTMRAFIINGAGDATWDLVRVRSGGIAADAAPVGTVRPLNEPPVAVASASVKQASVGDAVTFDASQSSDPDDDPLSYTWVFEGRHVATGAVVEHTFDFPGLGGAALIVSDGQGGVDSDSAWVTVGEAGGGG